MRWWIGLLAAAAITFALYSAGASYPVLYIARRIVLHLVGGH